MDRMKGKVAIVTGASRGLGRAVALEFAREGASVVVSARGQSPTGLPGTPDDTASAIRADGGEAFSVACDVSDEAQVRAMVEQTVDRYGKIDVLVNNAGVMAIGYPFLELTPDVWDQSFGTNVRGPYLTCRHVIPVMMKQGGGNIINVGSRAANGPSPGAGSGYAPTKAAVHMFSFCLAEEMREHNIAVNVLSPGGLTSEGSSVIPWARHDWHERVAPEEVGPSAVYIALQDAGSMTGQVLFRADFGKTWGPGVS